MAWVKIFKTFGIKRKNESENLSDLSHKIEPLDFQKKYIDRVKYDYAKIDFSTAMRNAKDISQVDLLDLFKFNLKLFKDFKRSMQESDFYKG
ncbi:MAG: hypothetical protein IJ923_01045 [Campylobacter sp.]|nr:hypothetical protein [Campylobacter sp.]